MVRVFVRLCIAIVVALSSEVNFEVQQSASRLITFRRGSKAETLAWTLIAFCRNAPAVVLGEVFHARAFRQILSN